MVLPSSGRIPGVPPRRPQAIDDLLDQHTQNLATLDGRVDQHDSDIADRLTEAQADLLYPDKDATEAAIGRLDPGTDGTDGKLLGWVGSSPGVPDWVDPPAGGGTQVYDVTDYASPALAFAAANTAGEGTVYFPPGTYNPPSNSATVPYSRIYGWAITSSNVNVELAPGAVIDGTALGTLAAAIEVQGARTADVATVTADIVAGTNTLTVASATGLAVGDTIVIRSSGEDYSNERTAGTYTKAEHATIAGIAGTTVTLTGPVLLDYDATSTYTVTIDVLDMPENITIRGGRITMKASDRHYGIRAYYARNVHVSTDIAQADEAGIEFYGCRDVVAHDMRADNIKRTQLGYGVRFSGCDNGLALRVTGRNVRHLLDCDGGYDDLPISTNITYDLGRGSDTTGQPFSSHAGCHTVLMRDCLAERSNGFFSVRSKNTTLINPKGRGIHYTAGEGSPHGLMIGENATGNGTAGENLTVTGMDLDGTYDSTVSVSSIGIYALAPLSNARIEGRVSGFRNEGAALRGLTMRDTDLDLLLDCSNQNGTVGDFVYGLYVAPVTAANGNNQKGVRARVEVVAPLRHAVRWEGNNTDVDVSERITLELTTREMANYAHIHMNTGYFGAVIIREAVAPTATDMTSGVQPFLFYTGANHATGPFLFRNLIGTTMYAQGTTAYT